MKKIIIVLMTFLFLKGCGYTPIYSGKNFDFKIKNIITNKNNQLNTIVEKRLKNFSNQKSQKIISLKLDTHKKINVLAKDSKGNPSRYEMIVEIKLETVDYQNQKIGKDFQESFNYNANANKFALNQYEKETEYLLINKNIESIVIYLSGL